MLRLVSTRNPDSDSIALHTIMDDGTVLSKPIKTVKFDLQGDLSLCQFFYYRNMLYYIGISSTGSSVEIGEIRDDVVLSTVYNVNRICKSYTILTPTHIEIRGICDYLIIGIADGTLFVRYPREAFVVLAIDIEKQNIHKMTMQQSIEGQCMSDHIYFDRTARNERMTRKECVELPPLDGKLQNCMILDMLYSDNDKWYILRDGKHYMVSDPLADKLDLIPAPNWTLKYQFGSESVRVEIRNCVDVCIRNVIDDSVYCINIGGGDYGSIYAL